MGGDATLIRINIHDSESKSVSLLMLQFLKVRVTLKSALV